jgi:hypothetical protein
MVDIDQQYLQTQQELLRDIREELRAQRSVVTAQATGATSATHPGGGTFAHAQAMSDRLLTGQWDTLGWSNAYRSTYTSSFLGDMGAVLGLSRAPETMTQSEYESLAGQGFGARISRTIGGIFAPGYTKATNAFAEELQRNSARFIRFGNSQASDVFGAGLDMPTALRVSRAIDYEALGNIRMSQDDYRKVASVGMQSNQFTDVSDVAGFRTRVRELASATEELTRSLHMTTTEVANVMGSLRMMGVGSVSEQRDILRHAGASALVSGLSPTEMLAVATRSGAASVAMGLSAGTGMNAAMNATAQLRAMSSGGLLTATDIARGGGIADMAQRMTENIQRFSMTDAGYLMYAGGKGRAGHGGFGAMTRAMGNMTYEDIVNMDADRFDVMQEATAGQLNNNFRDSITDQLKMLGVDGSTRMGQGYARRILQSQGWQAADAKAWVVSNLTEQGRALASATEMTQRRASAYEKLKEEYDQGYTANTFAGRMKRAENQFSRAYHSALDSVFTSTDTSGAQFDMHQQINLAAAAASANGNLGLEDRLNALGAPATSNDMVLRSGNFMTRAGLGMQIGGGISTAGAVVGGVALAGSMLAKAGIATAASGIGAAPGLILAGAGLAIAGGAAAYAYFADDKLVLNDSDRANVTTAAKAFSGASRDKGLAVMKNMKGAITGSAWEALLKKKFEGGAMSGEDQVQIAALLDQVVAENKDVKVNGEQITKEQAAAVLATQKDSVDFGLSVGSDGGLGQNLQQWAKSDEYKAEQDAFNRVLGKYGDLWNASDNNKTNFSVAAVQGDLTAYLKAQKSGDKEAIQRARAALAGKIGEDDINALDANLSSSSSYTDAGGYRDRAISYLEKTNQLVNATRLDRDLSLVYDAAADRAADLGFSKEDLAGLRESIGAQKESTRGTRDFGSLEALIHDTRLQGAIEKGELGEDFKKAAGIVANKKEFFDLNHAAIAKHLGVELSEVDKAIAGMEGQNLSKEEQAKRLYNAALSSSFDRKALAEENKKDVASENNRKAAEILERLSKVLDIEKHK